MNIKTKNTNENKIKPYQFRQMEKYFLTSAMIGTLERLAFFQLNDTND